jgi:hypothetical protein
VETTGDALPVAANPKAIDNTTLAVMSELECATACLLNTACYSMLLVPANTNVNNAVVGAPAAKFRCQIWTGRLVTSYGRGPTNSRVCSVMMD